MLKKLPETAEIETSILLDALNDPTKGSFLPLCLGDSAEKVNRVRIARNLVTAGLLGCTNFNHNRFELTELGESRALELRSLTAGAGK